CGTELADDEWVPGLTVDHEPVLYCAACWERLSRSYNAAGSGHLHKYSGIGKDWSRWGDVLPEDREVWAWMAEEETRPVQAWDREMQEDVEFRKNVWQTQLRLPEPPVLYRAYAFGWSHEEALHRSYLHALQRVTEADERVYAIRG